MYGEVYIDVVFVTNLIMDYLLVRMLGRLLHLKGSRLRCFIGAAAGAAGACLLLYLPIDSFFPIGLLLHGFLGLCMVRIAFDVRSGGLLIKAVTALYLAAFLCGGFWDVLTENTSMTLKTFLLFAACTYGVLTFLSVGRECFLARARHIFPVTLFYGGSVYHTAGLYDTGNFLKDPVNGAPVSVIGREALAGLFTEEIAEKLKHIQEEPGELEDTVIHGLKPRFLRFQGVEREGVMVAVTIEKLSIHAPREVIQIPHPVLAISLEPSTLGKDYQIILNSELMQ